LAITGEDSPESRNALLRQAKEHTKAIVVATMHSIGIGIDLTFCTQALFAELYYRPETVIQAIGRFSRLSGKVPSSVAILCVEGTADEMLAQHLLAKIAAINKVVQPGDSEAKLSDALGTQDEAAMLEALNQALAGGVEDVY
jgi:SNF2 family DNA or RNA helicase